VQQWTDQPSQRTDLLPVYAGCTRYGSISIRCVVAVAVLGSRAGSGAGPLGSGHLRYPQGSGSPVVFVSDTGTGAPPGTTRGRQKKTGDPRGGWVAPVMGGWVRGQKRTRVRFVFLIFFIVFF
jgi:hypothetical protein